MRISPAMLAVVLCAGSVVTAHAQLKPISGPTRGTATTGTLPSGVSFAYDAQQGKIDTAGVHLSTSTIKSNSVSPTTGTIIVMVHISLVSRFAAGTTYQCTANAIGGILDLDTGTVDGAVETASGTAVGGGTSLTCALRLPYSWTLAHDPGADSGLIIAFGASAKDAKGVVTRSTLQVDGIENLPANGAAETFSYNVVL
jgi:hypothetical protein